MLDAAARARRPRRDRLERGQPRRARRARGRRRAPARAGARSRSRSRARQGDVGGAPVRVDGKLQLLEGPRFPPGFDQALTPVFNTNTATFDLDALDREYDLTWLYVEKTADGRPAVQLERVYHEVTRFLETTYLEVPRSGPRGRFFPIKTPEDLERSQDALRELLAAPGRALNRPEVVTRA